MENKKLIQRINALLAEKGIEKKTFYKDCAITSSAFSQWSTGKTAPRTKKLEEIASYLGVSVPYLIGSPAENKKSPSSEEEGLSVDAMEAAILFDRAEPWMRRQVLELLRAAEFHRAAPGDDPTAE